MYAADWVYLSQGSVLGSAPVKQKGRKDTHSRSHSNPRRTEDRDKGPHRKTENRRHRTQKATQGAAEKRKQEQSFSSPVSCAVLGPAPLFCTPAVSSLDTDPGVATVVLPTACWRALKWPRCAGVLQLLKIVYELVGTVEASASRTTALPDR